MGKKIVAVLLVLLLAGSGAAMALDGQADGNLSPGDAFYDTIMGLKASQYGLAGSLLEQALLQNDLADQLVDAIMAEEDEEVVEELFEDLGKAEAAVDGIMSLLMEEDPVDDPADDPVDDPADDPVDDPADDPVDDPADDPVDDPADDPVDDPADDPVDDPGDDDEGDGDDEIDEIISGRERRGWRLREKVADETLPAHVRANAQKALDNMARAMEKQAWKAALKAAWAESEQEGPPPWANGKPNRNGGGNGDIDEGDDEGDGAESDDDMGDDTNSEAGNGEQEDDGASLNAQGSKSASPGNNGSGNPGKSKGRNNAPGQLKKKQ